MKRRLPQRGGTEPAPYRRSGGARGGVRLGCGFCHPNSKTEFGASVVGIGPYAPRGDERAARRGREGMGGKRGRDHPKSVQQRRTIPQSRPLAVPAPFAQGSLWGRGRGLPRRPCGPPRNDNGFLSFRGQCVHWPWESVLFYDGRGFGPPGRRTLRKARSTTKPAGAQQSVRASGREEWAGIDAGTIKKGQASAIARAALSEAESAERGAGQIRFLPDK